MQRPGLTGSSGYLSWDTICSRVSPHPKGPVPKRAPVLHIWLLRHMEVPVCNHPLCLQAMWEMGTDGPELPLGLLKIKSLCTTIPVSPVQQQIDKHRLKQVTSKCSRRDSSSSPQVFAISKHLLASSSSVNNLKPCRYPDLIQKLTFSKHLTQN